MFLVRLNDGVLRRCHGDQLRHRVVNRDIEVEEDIDRDDDDFILHPNTSTNEVLPVVHESPSVTPTIEPPHVYPRRVRVPPDRYSPSHSRK